MRLTNVVQMDLVGGQLRSYAVRLTPDRAAPLPISFDQERHVGEGNRPGSWMAIAFRLAFRPTDEQIAAAWDAVVARHGTLRTVFTLTPSGGLELHDAAASPGQWEDHPVPAGQPTRAALRELLDATCTPFSAPSHRLCTVDPPAGSDDPRQAFVLASDHAHVDMWSLVLLVRELVICLDELRAGQRPGAALEPAAPFSEHSAILAALPAAPDEVHERWEAILDAGGGMMPTFPLDLGELTPLPGEVVEVRDILDADEMGRFAALARAQGVRPIALAISVLTRVTAELTDRPLRAVFPVHSRHEARWRDACGWFITNAVIESADPDPAACADAVTEATRLGSWPLAPLLAPYGGMPAGPGMFAISWLDTRKLPVPAAEVSELRYVSASIRTDGVMLWFMVNASGLHVRCRYPDTPQARANVGRWLDAMEQGLQALPVQQPAA